MLKRIGERHRGSVISSFSSASASVALLTLPSLQHRFLASGSSFGATRARRPPPTRSANSGVGGGGAATASFRPQSASNAPPSPLSSSSSSSSSIAHRSTRNRNRWGDEEDRAASRQKTIGSGARGQEEEEWRNNAGRDAKTSAAAVKEGDGPLLAPSTDGPMIQRQFQGFTAEGHAARLAFAALVDRIVWHSAMVVGEGEGEGAAEGNGSIPDSTTAPAGTTAVASDSNAISTSNNSGGALLPPPPSLDEVLQCFEAAWNEMRDVLGLNKGSAFTPTPTSTSTPNGAEGVVSSSSSAALSPSSTTSMISFSNNNYPTPCAACASFVTDLEAREAVVAFVDAVARLVQCEGAHRLVEKKLEAVEEKAETSTETEKDADEKNRLKTIIPTLRSTAIAAASHLLPHAAEAHDSIDEAVALLTCASAVLTLAPPPADKRAMQKLLVPATIVSRKLLGSDLATLLLCLARTYDATEDPTSSSSVYAGGGGSNLSFLSYTTLSDLKSLEMELFRRFDATFAKYCVPPPSAFMLATNTTSSCRDTNNNGDGGEKGKEDTAAAAVVGKTNSGGSSVSSSRLSSEQREAHRRNFIAARQRALLTLTDVAEIATAFAIHRFVGSSDVLQNEKDLLRAKGDDANTLSGGNNRALLRHQQHSANTSLLWRRIIQYTMDFISHDLRLGKEMKEAAEAAMLEQMLNDAAEEEEGEGHGMTSKNSCSSAEEAKAKFKDDDDFIDTTFTKADIQSICFALDRVGCSEGYHTLMTFLVEKGIVKEFIPPPSAAAFE